MLNPSDAREHIEINRKISLGHYQTNQGTLVYKELNPCFVIFPSKSLHGKEAFLYGLEMHVGKVPVP